MKKAVFAPAKVNLSLDVKSKYPDGFHEIDSLMASVSLGDWLFFSAADTFQLDIDNKFKVDLGENLITRAVNLLSVRLGRALPVKIKLLKKIPIAAGLAGGSTDAAAALHGVNQYLNLGLTLPELQKIGAELGADIPFCLAGGFCRTRGLGGELYPVAVPVEIWMVLVTPPVSVSTALIYKEFDAHFNYKPFSFTGRTVEACLRGRISTMPGVWGNDLEQVTFRLFPQVKELKETLQGYPEVIGAIMSGSGPTIVCLVEGERDGARLMEKINLLSGDLHACLVKTIKPRFILEDEMEERNY